MRDLRPDDEQARSMLQQQLANYRKTAACLGAVGGRRFEILAELVQAELDRFKRDTERSKGMRRTAGRAWGRPERDAKLRGQDAGRSRPGIAAMAPRPSRGRVHHRAVRAHVA